MNLIISLKLINQIKDLYTYPQFYFTFYIRYIRYETIIYTLSVSTDKWKISYLKFLP